MFVQLVKLCIEFLHLRGQLIQEPLEAARRLQSRKFGEPKKLKSEILAGHWILQNIGTSNLDQGPEASSILPAQNPRNA